MRLALSVLALLLGLSAFSSHAAFARDPYASDEAPAAAAAEDSETKKNAVPFRQDSGLITAEYYLSTGKYAAALNVLEGVLQRHPESADAFTYRGYAFYKMGDRRKARENFAKAILIDPTHLGANRYIAQSYIDAGDLTRAYEQMQVIRMTCGRADCEELDELEAQLNRYRRGQRVKDDNR